MCSLDIGSLYTNIPVAETIDLIWNNIYTNGVLVYKGISRENFRNLSQRVLNSTCFKFNGKIYKRKEGFVMGQLPSPTVANIFLNYFEIKCLAGCPDDFKPQYYRRYLEDTFLIIHNEQQAKFS